MFGTAVRVVLWGLVLVQGAHLVVGGVQAAAKGMKLPDEESPEPDESNQD